jgi:hypothetical protein
MTRFPLAARLGIALGIGLPGSAALASAAHAQAMQARYWFEAQAYWPDVDTTVSIAGPNGRIGTKIDLESDLDLSDRKTLPAFQAGARLGERWSLVGEYYGLDRNGSSQAARDITFDDVTYSAGAALSSGFDTKIYRAAVGYAFIQGDRGELGASVGLHLTQFKISIAGEGHVGNAAVQSELRKRDALAPLPTLGLYSGYTLTSRLTASARVDYLSLKVGDYDGRLVNTEARLGYRLLDHVELGAAYRYVDYDLNIDKARWQGELAYKFKGPAVFLRAVF